MSARASAPRVLNYDPADPDKMRLPAGITCGDCVHIRRCSAIFGHTATDKTCDWSPSRFQAAPKGWIAEPKTCLGCGAKFTTIPEGGLPCGH